ncbi:MAG: DUF6164 family protein [Nitrosomonas sp.]|nr:DUF6164 family protein [Nitrosomonas sp.]MDP1951156.1 DUF6164 family protein [Nitrosomonas sp.]
MSKLLFKLRGVPDDEAEDVRELLADNEIDFYETSAGNWGFSMPGIWLRDADQFEKAKDLLDEYQKARGIRAREEYARLKREGKNRTFIDWARENPVQLILFSAIIAAVLYLQAMLVINIGE